MNPIAEQSWHQTIDNALSRLDADLAVKWYLFALLASALAYLALTPIGSGDTDLWYHLNGGRLLAESGELPRSAFFSFTEAPGEWVNYFWGFQALSFQVFSLAGYEGLIGLRILLAGVAIGAIMALLIRANDSINRKAWSLAVLILVLIVLMGRTQLIRPHLVSFAMITVFLVILERRRNWLPALPVLTVIWVNTHGVEWVVGAAICGAYFIEEIGNWRRDRRPLNPESRAILIWTTACLPAMFVNPFGLGILAAPFSTPPDVYAYIKELRPVTFQALISTHLSIAELSFHSAVSMLFFGNILAYGALLLKGSIRPAPLILSIVGLLLLFRGQRFMWEWVFLSLPLWRHAIDAANAKATTNNNLRVSPATAALAVLLISPLMTWFPKNLQAQTFPLDGSKLPTGITQFIRSQDIKGKVLAPADSGGYLAWRLYPDVLISADMQSPPTTPWTHYRTWEALKNPHAMQRFVSEFEPELIALAYDQKGVRQFMGKQPIYRPVFFDDMYALYANAERLPDVVSKFELKHVNPHNLLDDDLGTNEQRLRELEHVLHVHPDGDRAQQGIIRLLIKEGRHEDALKSARRYLESRPENPNGYFLIGSVLEKLDRCDEAKEFLNDAFAVASHESHKSLHLQLGTCAYLTKDFDAAFEHFDKAINTYLDTVEPEHRFQFALSAVAVGEDETARTLLRHLVYAADPSDTTAISKAQALLSDL